MGPSLVSRNSEIMSGALCFTGTHVPFREPIDYLEGALRFLENFSKIFHPYRGTRL